MMRSFNKHINFLLPVIKGGLSIATSWVIVFQIFFWSMITSCGIYYSIYDKYSPILGHGFFLHLLIVVLASAVLSTLITAGRVGVRTYERVKK